MYTLNIIQTIESSRRKMQVQHDCQPVIAVSALHLSVIATDVDIDWSAFDFVGYSLLR